jgi:voltage-gated potassium channel Kch
MESSTPTTKPSLHCIQYCSTLKEEEVELDNDNSRDRHHPRRRRRRFQLPTLCSCCFIYLSSVAIIVIYQFQVAASSIILVSAFQSSSQQYNSKVLLSTKNNDNNNNNHNHKRKRYCQGSRISHPIHHHHHQNHHSSLHPRLWELSSTPNELSEVNNFPDEMSEFGFFEDMDDGDDGDGVVGNNNNNQNSYDNDGTTTTTTTIGSQTRRTATKYNYIVQETSMYDSEPAYCAINLDDLTVPYISPLDSESTFIEYTEDGICVPAGRVGRLKEQTANFLKTPSVEIIIALVVVMNSLLVAISTLDSMDYYLPAIRVAETFVVTIFCADFSGRWFSSSRPTGRFVLDPQFIVDVLVVILPLVVGFTPASWMSGSFLPSALTQPSGLFNVQLLRVLRLRRILQDLDTFERFMERALGTTNVQPNVVKDWQLQLARVLLTLFTLISVSTGLIYTAENAVNPNINNYFDALYFGLTTLTTVGFGDVTPVTSQGRLVVCGSILFGIAVVPAQGAALLEALLEGEQAKKDGTSTGTRNKSKTNNSAITARAVVPGRTRNDNDDADGNNVLALDTTTRCPHCGASFHWASAQYCYSCGGEL